MLNFAPDISRIFTPDDAVFSACGSQDDTHFTFNVREETDREAAADKSSRIVFARDGLVFQSSGSQVDLTVPHDIMREIFSEALNRRVFSIAVFERNIGHLSPHIEPVAAILRHLLAKLDSDDYVNVLATTMLHNLARHVAYSWPSTHSAELSFCVAKRPPLPLRIALDFIYFRRGVVESVHDVAAHTNVGLRALEIMFSDWLGIGVKRYCKSIMLRMISERLQTNSQRLTRLALEFGVSNVGRLRKELTEYAASETHTPYPWEIYDPSRRISRRL